MSHFPQISCSAADACPPFWGASPQDCIKSQKRQQKIGDIALFPPGRKTRKLYIYWDMAPKSFSWPAHALHFSAVRGPKKEEIIPLRLTVRQCGDLS